MDNKTVLDPEDDAAFANWGGSWRMPTEAEWNELTGNCTLTWTTRNGVNGRLVTSTKNSNSIFLPAAGCRYDIDAFYEVGVYGLYWSSSLDCNDSSGAMVYYFGSGTDMILNGLRGQGFSVRPVTE